MEEEVKADKLPRPLKKKSTLERLHLGFIARLIGRGGYASADEDEESKGKSSIADSK